MGFFDIVKHALSSNSSSQRTRRNDYYTPRRMSPEEFVIYEQKQTREKWHGVYLFELSELAQETYRGKYVEVDEYGFLVFEYTSNSGKTRLHAQCELDDDNQLVRPPHRYYPGQWKDSADDFVELANQNFSFR